MFEIIGLLFAIAGLCILSVVLGGLFGLAAWLLLWGRRKSKKLIFMAALVPPASAGYLLLSAVVLAFVVPNQPDDCFGDFSEPLPHGYVLKGLGKMPDWAYFDTNEPSKLQPLMPGRIGRLEEQGEMIYGAYSHLYDEQGTREPQKGQPAYFAFDTRNGSVMNFETLQQLNEQAGHNVQLQEPQFFRSQLPGRILLRKVESVIYLGPPVAATLLSFLFVLRFRFRNERQKGLGIS